MNRSEEDLDTIKSFLTKFQVTRPPRLRAQDQGDEEDRVEDEDDVLQPYDAPGKIKYQEQLVSHLNHGGHRRVLP